MIDVREAVNKAVRYFSAIYEGKFSNVLVEEVESDDKYWYITLGYDLPPTTATSIIEQLRSKAPRAYKLFKLDGINGDVVSMKIREVEHV